MEAPGGSSSSLPERTSGSHMQSCRCRCSKESWLCIRRAADWWESKNIDALHLVREARWRGEADIKLSELVIIIIIIICSVCNARHINPLGSQGAAVWQPQRTHRLLNLRQTSRLCTHNKRPETMDQKYERILIFRVGGNRSARRKPTKAGMESANQIHIQPLASCIGERKVFEY